MAAEAGSARPVPGSDEAIRCLYERVAGACVAGEKGSQVLREMLWEPTVVIGTGGSHPSADYIARLLREEGTAARSAYPLEEPGPERQMVAVCYSGKTPDIAEAIRRGRERSIEKVLLLTGAGAPQIASESLVCHRRDPDAEDGAAGVERGFMSFSSTVCPAAAVLAGLRGTQGIFKGFTRAFWRGALDALCRAEVVDVVADGWGWPTALDLESKWTEAALGEVVLHESKNLSHGRYQSVFGHRAAQRVSVVVSVGPVDAYGTYVRGALSAKAPLVEIVSGVGGAVGGLGVLYASQELCALVGRARRVDVSRPAVIAEEGLTMHKWKWEAEPKPS